MSTEKRIDITQPLWDQSTFAGRFRHFAFISNPLLSLAPEKELYEAKELYFKYKEGKEPAGTPLSQVVRAKQLYESAFHPDSGELQNVFGRMSFQMPGGCLITGAMLQWYRTTTAVVFWQWVNQSFNALVNYTNRNAASPLSTTQMGVAYISATSAAMITAFSYCCFVIQAVSFFKSKIVSFRTTTAVVFWQWVNQSFNALVNYTNRNAASPLSTTQMGVAYISATSAAMITAFSYCCFVIQAVSFFKSKIVSFRTTTAVVFWQWVNQSFNALVNYTNRNAASPLSTTQMGVAYISATSAAMITAFTFKFGIQKRAKNPILARFVPFAAVAAANWVNIPLMRQNEILLGLDVTDENGKIIGKSQLAPVKGISQVVTSRIVMCAPGMLLLPVIMERLEPKAWMQRIKWAHIGIQTGIVGIFLTFMVPTACAIFPQKCKLSIDTIKRFEKDRYEEIMKNTDGKPPQYVYFNKGL
ncbi:sideroflexin-2 [Bicyclus anynana]|uniref:Sideroflexin-2 n=1 Tax=Bicyclus anynana TaxID=110368 RepID=A0ABM3LPR2_BICAN|nr:sideroflexin-2 [Bicyclus anynana]